MTTDWEITWLDAHRIAQNKPDPRFPQGVALDMSAGARAFCESPLPYPAPRCGMYLIRCNVCGTDALITAAGRPDDPCSVRLACKPHPEHVQ